MKGSQNFPDIQVLHSNRMSAMNMHLFAALRADAVRILYVQGSLITVGSTAGPVVSTVVLVL